MSGVLILVLTALRLGEIHHNYTGNETYHELPRFWTNTGFCPAGNIDHKGITASLLSDATLMQLRQIAALPTGASITHIRIHWLLELLQFEEYTQAGVPIYDFTDLDKFLVFLDDLGLYPVIEFMANPGNVFNQNPNQNGFLWTDLSYQVTKRYLNLFGAKKVLNWRFETWNEPDLVAYNRLHFSTNDFLIYANGIKQGLSLAGRRTENSLHFPLRGPAGLFKSKDKHPICWHILESCNADIKECPFEVLTYHRKGNGTDNIFIMDTSASLLQTIYKEYPTLKALQISNDEADPISDWSLPRSFHEDVRYATTLVSIVLLHWQAKLERAEFKQFESLSHDNAFLSYHPNEFSQRTLLAHFRMNQTQPPHSQFIQKPVYAALGLLSKLGRYAAPLEVIVTLEERNVWLLKTENEDTEPLYMSWLLIPQNINENFTENFTFKKDLPFELCEAESYVYIVEGLEQTKTDPAYIWRKHNSPPYPNASLREQMRLSQTPRLLNISELHSPFIELNIDELISPWIVLIRVCSNLGHILKKPQQLAVDFVTHNEVFATWREVLNSTQCLKSYEVWFKSNESLNWKKISENWHLPFPSFQYAPIDGSSVNGFYKVRGVDIFGKFSPFSDSLEYIEIITLYD